MCQMSYLYKIQKAQKFHQITQQKPQLIQDKKTKILEKYQNKENIHPPDAKTKIH